MAYSKVIIIFNSIPNDNEVLKIAETSQSLNLNEIFKVDRYTTYQTAIPPSAPEDGYRPDRYIGYISELYKKAFNEDYNFFGLFTVTVANGDLYSGLGQVVIKANFPDAVFVLDTNTTAATVLFVNVSGTTPPPDTISFSPDSVSFVHEQNSTLPSSGIAFYGSLWKIVGKPNFLLSSVTAGVTITSTGSGSGLYQTISGSGPAIINIGLTSYYDSDIDFTGGDLAGTFEVLKNNVSEGTIAYAITVTKLSDFLTIPYTSGQKAFTLDTKFFEIQSENEDSYFQFDANIKTYEFFTNELKENNITQKVVLFQGKSKINLGQIIHRLMQNFTAVNENLLQYKEAVLKITCSEKLIQNESIIRTGQSADIPFIAGLSRGITTLGFLDFNPKANRVTINSFAYLNILTPAGNYELRTLKNGTLVGTAEALPASSGIVFCKKVFFDDYNQGDIIQFVVDIIGESNSTAPKKTFKVFPEGNYSNRLVWENEFLLQSAIECTGTASIIPEVEFQSQTVQIDLVESLEHLSSTKKAKLLMDTGWLLKSDIDTIESLMRSKKVWLIQGNNSISLRPIAKSLPKFDLEDDLISYPLEFQINPTYNEETYSL